MTQPLQKSETQVLTAEQGHLIDRAKLYATALDTTERHAAVYTFLLGGTLHALKESTPHGQFEQLREITFGERHETTFTRSMQYFDAARYFANSKSCTVQLFTPNRLLLATDVTEKEKDRLAQEIGQAAPDGVIATIKNWRKKTAKPVTDTQDPLAKQKAQIANMEAFFETAEAALQGILNLKPQDFVLVSPALRQSVAAHCVRVNKKCAELRRKKPSTK